MTPPIGIPISCNSRISKGSLGRNAAAVNPSPAVCCTATVASMTAEETIRTSDCSAAAAACWVEICWARKPIPSVHRGDADAALTGCAGEGAVAAPRRV